MNTYFYRVNESVNDFQGSAFDCSEEFRSPKLLDARQNAIAYHNQRLKGIMDKGELFGKPILQRPAECLPQDFDLTKWSNFSIIVSLVEVTESGEEFEYPILGDTDDEELTRECIQHEKRVIDGTNESLFED